MLTRIFYVGDEVVIEEFLTGQSFLFLVSSMDILSKSLITAQDHKQVKDNDQDPNSKWSNHPNIHGLIV